MVEYRCYYAQLLQIQRNFKLKNYTGLVLQELSPYDIVNHVLPAQADEARQEGSETNREWDAANIPCAQRVVPA